jgi:hypothetical protein
MSWLSEFEDELVARRVPRSSRERLAAELSDHLECEQGWETRLELTRLGAAREIAGQCPPTAPAGARGRRSLPWR